MKDRFIEIYTENIKREGAEELLKMLVNSDFFTAPASTRYHMACNGGLVRHSVNVYERLKALCEFESQHSAGFKMPSPETIAICGLLHDVCKIGIYKTEMRNRKNSSGQWEQYPFYITEDSLPYGHGEKSVYMVSSYMKLSRDEAMAIRWHMGFSDADGRDRSQTLGRAFTMHPLSMLTFMADMQATFIDEAEQDESKT